MSVAAYVCFPLWVVCLMPLQLLLHAPHPPTPPPPPSTIWLLPLQHQKRHVSSAAHKQSEQTGSLKGLVTVSDNRGETISPRPLDLSIILRDTQGSLWQNHPPPLPSPPPTPQEAPPCGPLRLDHNTVGCSNVKSEETELLSSSSSSSRIQAHMFNWCCKCLRFQC